MHIPQGPTGALTLEPFEQALAAALDFEFELPYPDGSRMGLSQRAREAFEHRLGIRLPPPTKGEAK